MKIILLFFVLLFPTIISAGTVVLSWVAPSEREDNTALSPSDIAGYTIYYGSAPGDYMESIYINDPAATGYSITSLVDGTYYFVVTTRDTDGRESMYSSEVVETITPTPSTANPNTVQQFALSQGVVQ